MAKKKTKKTSKKAPKKKAAPSRAPKKKTTKKKAAKKAATRKKTTKKKAVKKKAARTKSKPKKKAAKKKASKKKVAKKTTKKKAGPTAKRNGQARRSVAPAGTRPIGWHGPDDGPEPINGTPLTDAQLRRVKTDLSRKDMAFFRQLLLEKRAEIVGDVAHMESSRNDSSSGNLSHMPLHMADIGSDNYEQEFTLGLMESEKRLLREIDEALLRIAGKTYGVCVQSGEPINRARLEIKPWAKYSIAVARERERMGL